MTKEGKVTCLGEIEHRGRHISVHCSGCAGPMSLSDRICFMGLSERITPGFTGSVILRAGSDTRYKGTIVEALSSCSEIKDLIGSIGLKGASRKGKSLRDDLMRSFMDDPRSLVDMDHTELLKKMDPSEREQMKAQLDTIAERTRRMLVRLEG
jgi:hypothetical protein